MLECKQWKHSDGNVINAGKFSEHLLAAADIEPITIQ